MPNPKSPKVSRRRFLQTTGAFAGGVALGNSLAPRAHAAPRAPQPAPGFSVNLTFDKSDPVATSTSAQWALARFRSALESKGIRIKSPADVTILIRKLTSQNAAPNPPESLAISTQLGAPTTIAQGADPLGLVYALMELTDRVEHAPNADALRAALLSHPPVREQPANKIRGIFRIFVSEIEDKLWFYDRDHWQNYLDMLVTNRFNRFNLSFGLSYDFSRNLTDTYTFFMYPFFVNVPGHNVRALDKSGTPLPQAEQQKNLDTLKFISDQCALRGLQFNLGIWTHNYIWQNSPNASHTISGLNAQTQAPYSRDAMRMILAACPAITGVTLRTHGESGVPEGSYDLWKIIMAGITGLKHPDGSPRIIELDMHAKTMTQEMIDTAHTTNMPVTISCKFWAEHLGLPYVQASIRESEMPRISNATGLMALSSGTRSFLRYGIGDLLSKDRNYNVIHRVWPGSQRLLLWGDPLYAAEYGRAAHFAGMDGIEYFEPLSFKGRQGSGIAAPDRSGYADPSLRTTYDWQKYLYTYRLWGRLSYNPDAAPEIWQRHLQSECGPAAAPHVETALASASRILPLITTAHDPAAANLEYWPEIYVNMSLYDVGKVANYAEAPSPKVFGNVSSLDPQLFSSINQFADSLLSDKPLAKISPLAVARQLETWSTSANRAIADIPAEKSPASRRASIDAAISAGIGLFFAHKIRAAILWQLFNLTGHQPARTAALDAYKSARTAWATLSDTAKVYVEDLTFGPTRHLRHHWKERLADIDTDIAGLATVTSTARSAVPPAQIDKLIQSILPPLPSNPFFPAPRHTCPNVFTPGQPVPLGLTTLADSARLSYRHLHQGERYTTIDMQKQPGGFAAVIPAAFTNSSFPIQYFFEVRTPAAPTLFPGFRENFTGTPYFTLLIN